jgi:hypothetical protein
MLANRADSSGSCASSLSFKVRAAIAHLAKAIVSFRLKPETNEASSVRQLLQPPGRHSSMASSIVCTPRRTRRGKRSPRISAQRPFILGLAHRGAYGIEQLSPLHFGEAVKSVERKVALFLGAIDGSPSPPGRLTPNLQP